MEEKEARDPAWPYVLAGWLLAATLLAPPDREPGERLVRARAPFGALDPPTRDADRMSPRELRRLPAIGPARAQAIARARWEEGLRGGPESWDEVPGIGPETVRSILRSGTTSSASSPSPSRSP